MFGICLVICQKTYAEQFYGIGVTLLEFGGPEHTNVNALTGLVGYKFGKKNFTLSPTFRFLKGDKSSGTELGEVFIFSIKTQYTFNNGMYFFSSPSIGSFTYSNPYKYSSQRKKEKDVEFGLNAGIGFQFSKDLSTEIFYEKFKSSKALAVGITFRF
jgi:hypothetical protein